MVKSSDEEVTTKGEKKEEQKTNIERKSMESVFSLHKNQR
jgi:hypothetical protein